MDLSIIIVNWNSGEFTKDCIKSIQDTLRSLKYEIIVVDNASQDDSCEIISQAYPSIDLIRSELNIGFARANNLGAERSRGGKLLFLNPDTLVLENAIRIMTMRLDLFSGIAAIGCRILNPDLSLQDCVQYFPTLTNQLFANLALKRWLPMLQVWNTHAPASRDSDHTYEVEVIPGACLMVDREVFKQVGCFSTGYFMYAEEVDLCYKISHAGWRLCCTDDAQIIHYGGQSTKQRGGSFSHVVMRESVFRLLRKFRGDGYAFLYRVALLISALVRISVLLPLIMLPDGIVDHNGIVWRYEKWNKIARWCLALEGWTHELGNG